MWIKEDYFNLSTVLNLKKPMGIRIFEYTQTRAFIISKRSMNLYEQLHPMETNMSKGVGEHFIYLCILEFLQATFVDGSFEAAVGVACI